MRPNGLDGVIQIVIGDGDQLVAGDLLQIRDPDTRLAAAPEPPEGVGVIAGAQQLRFVIPAAEDLEGLVVQTPGSPRFVCAADEADTLTLAVLEDAQLVVEDAARVVGECDPDVDDVVRDQGCQQLCGRYRLGPGKKHFEVRADGGLGVAADLVGLFHGGEVFGCQRGRADQAHVPTAPDEVGERQRNDVIQGAREVADRPVVADGFLQARHVEVVK